MADLYEQGVRSLLDGIASPSPTPGSGAVAGIVTAMAGGLIASAARRSPDWPDGRGVAAQAQALRGRVERLAEANVQAYVDALELLAVPARPSTSGDGALGKALETAADLPLAIAETALDVALLGAEAAEHAAPGCAEDGAAAAVLAEAAARAAAGLVAANLITSPGDERAMHAQRLVSAATAAARQAVASATPV